MNEWHHVGEFQLKSALDSSALLPACRKIFRASALPTARARVAPGRLCSAAWGLFFSNRGASTRPAPRREYPARPTAKLRVARCSCWTNSSIIVEIVDRVAAMGRLLSLAVLVGALWAIDSYAFHGRYQAAALEEVDYYAQTLNDEVQRFVSRIRP